MPVPSSSRTTYQGGQLGPRQSVVRGRVGRFVLPILHTLGRVAGDASLADRALDLYRRYPATAPNRVTREMARQLGGEAGAAHARTACRQQGLIHLYKHWCDARDCPNCSTRTSPDSRRCGRDGGSRYGVLAV